METGTTNSPSLSPSTKPAGSRAVGAAVGDCPAASKRETGTISVWVEKHRKDGGTGALRFEESIAGATVDLNSGRGGTKESSRVGNAFFGQCAPGPYQITLSLAALPALAGAQILPESPGADRFDLPPGGKRSVVFHVVPPVTSLKVLVCDPAGQRIGSEEFEVFAARGQRRTQAARAGAATFTNFAPDDCGAYQVGVSLTPDQRLRYKAPAQPANAVVEHGKSQEVTLVLTPVLGVSIVSITPVFAPTRDDVEVACKVRNPMGVHSMLFEMTDCDAKVVFQEVRSRSRGTLPAFGGAEGRATLRWPRDRNGSPHALDPLVDPHGIIVGRSPFTARIWVSEEDLATPADFKSARSFSSAPAATHRTGLDQTVVRCHSLRLEAVPWGDVFHEVTGRAYDMNQPPVAESRAVKVAWIKTALNAMGFFAGPIDSDEQNQDFGRALMRYRAMRIIPRDPHVVPAGAAVHVPNETPRDLTQYDGETFYDGLYKFDGANSVLPEPAKRDAMTVLDQDASVDQLLVFLSMENPAVVLEKRVSAADPLQWTPLPGPADFDDPSAELRLLLRNNRYYMATNGEWDGVKWDFTADQNNCYKIAAGWLSRPCLPVRAVVSVEDRNGAPQNVPGAVQGVKVSWSWTDAAETLDHLPAYNTPSRVVPGKLCASRTRAYVQAAWNDARRDTPSALYHNTPLKLGGRITSVDNDNSWDAFAPLMGGADFAAEDKKPAQANEPGFILTPVRSVTNAARVTSSAAYIYLRPSTIGGDNYRLSARLDFSGHGAREAALKALHVAQTGADEVINPDLPGSAYKLTESRLTPTRSARIVVWRQMTLAAFVQWPERRPPNSWNNSAWSQAEWDLVRREYADAYVDLPVWGARPVLNISDRAQFPTLEADYATAIAAVPKDQRTGWETPGLEIELGTVKIAEVSRYLINHLKIVAGTRPDPEGAKDALELVEKWIADGRPGAAALREAGQFYKNAIEAITEAGATLAFKSTVTKASLSARPQRDFTADGTINLEFKKALFDELDSMKPHLALLNEALKSQYLPVPPAGPTNADPVWDLAQRWIANTDPDPVAQGILAEAGQYYKTAMEAVTDPGAAPATRSFKAGLNKSALGKRPQKDFVSIGPNAGKIAVYKHAFTDAFPTLRTKLGTLNQRLVELLSLTVDPTELNSLAGRIPVWKQRNLAQWQAIYPDWTDEYTAAIRAAADHYENVLRVAARENPPGTWVYTPGLTQATVINRPVGAPDSARPGDGWSPYFADEKYPTPCAIKEYKPDDSVYAASYRLRNDGLYPFRLHNNRYDLATAREMMANAAAQVGFALTMLLHRTIRRKLLLRVNAATHKFERLSDGAIMTDNITHPPMTLAGGQPWTPFGLSMGSDLGVFFTSHFTPFRLYALTAHEWAHTLILQHWFNAGGAPKTEHDQSDMNCMMGYPYLIGQGTQLPPVGSNERRSLEEFVAGNGERKKYDKFLAGEDGSFAVYKERLLPMNHTPHFCGKCNLQLRGWNIYAGASNPVLPRSSAGQDRNEDAFPQGDPNDPLPFADIYNPLTFDDENL